MKRFEEWDATEPQRGTYTFATLDTFFKWAQSNEKLVRGTTFVWHSQLPSWVSSISDPATMTSVIQTHISTIASRYKGKVYAWDVVSEPLNEDGTLRTSVFQKVLGEDYIPIVFKAARAADPSAKLYISEYNIDSVILKQFRSANLKVDGMVALVNRQKAAGTPIDGIGSESQFAAGGADGLQAALTKLATTGCEVALTELDVDYASSADYTTAVAACLNVPQCIGISLSGLSDKDSWRVAKTPLLFDSNYQKKPAYNAIISLLS